MCNDIKRLLTVVFSAALLVAGILATPTTAQSQEYWGVIVNSFTHDDQWVYGLSWNFPTEREAEQAAVKECIHRGGIDCDNDQRGILTFSTAARPARSARYMDISGTARAQYVAVGVDRRLGFVEAYVGNSEAEAIAALREGEGDTVIFQGAECNTQ